MGQQSDLVSQSMNVPTGCKGFGRTVRLANRNNEKLQRRIARAAAAGQAHRVRNLQNILLASRSGRLTSVAVANKKLPKQRRVPIADLPRIAARLNPWRGSSEHAVANARVKSGGRFRAVLSFGLEHRALQGLAGLVIAPTLEIDSRQHGWKNGGRDAACTKIIEAIEAGGKWFIGLDIANFYPSIEKGGLNDLIKLPNEIIDKVICPPENILCGHIGNTIDPVGLVSVAREGISQGSSVSVLVAEAIVSSVLRGVQSDATIINFADDFGIVARRRAEAEAIAQALTRAFRRCPCGPFQLKRKTSICRATKGFDFLGYHVKVGENGVWCMPSDANRKRFNTNVLRRSRELRGSRSPDMIIRLRNYIRSWAAGFRLWDDGGDVFWPRRWAVGVIRQHLPAMSAAITAMLEWDGAGFTRLATDFEEITGRDPARELRRQRRAARQYLLQNPIQPMWA